MDLRAFIEFAYAGLVSTLLGLVAGVTYAKAYRGLLLSASFVHTIVVTIPIVTLSVLSIRTISIDSSFSGQALAFSMVGLLGLIRFRTVVRDTREFTFIFLAIVTGVGVGSGLLLVSAVTCCLLLALLVLLQASGFGTPLAPSLKVSATGRADAFAEYQAALTSVSARITPVVVLISNEKYTYEFEVEAHRGQTLASVAAALQTVPGTSTVDVVRLQRGGSKSA